MAGSALKRLMAEYKRKLFRLANKIKVVVYAYGKHASKANVQFIIIIMIMIR